MTLNRELPTGKPTVASQESSAEAPIALGELLDERAERLLVASAEALGVEIHLVDHDGRRLVGGEIPAEVTSRAGRELRLVRSGPAQGWLGQPLVLDGWPAGLLAFGPFLLEDEEAVRRIAGHIRVLVENLLELGLERAATAQTHSQSIEVAHEELHQKNLRLALAVSRLEELDKIKSNFLATVSHELRTPLTSIIGYSEMLIEGLAGELNREQKEYVTTVMEKGEQLLGIITGILDISKIEAGGVKLDRSRFAVGEVITSALSTVAPAARRKRLTIDTMLAPDLPEPHGDRDKVRQVLINLIGNAVKFTPSGGRIEVRADLAPLGGPTADPASVLGLRVAITDSGIGIPTEVLDKIFEPFFQVDGSSTREYGGTGLGLSIVRSFVTAHGGVVWAESTPGQGSTFFATLPITESPE